MPQLSYLWYAVRQNDTITIMVIRHAQLSYLWYTVKQNDTITIMVIRHAPVVLPLVYSQAERNNNNHGNTTCPSCLTSGIQSGRTIQ